MTHRRIDLQELAIGEPLRFDVYDVERRLLLGKGNIIESHAHATTLAKTGIYADATALCSITEAPAPCTPTDPSVLRSINRLHRRLEHVLFNLHSVRNAPDTILEIARELCTTVEFNPDIALACILLNQDEGTYAVRHCIDTASVALLVARVLNRPPSEVLIIVAASLTMNIGMLRNQEQLQSRLNAISGQELAAIQAHPEEGVTMLQLAGITDPDWLSYVLLHHENEDGSGYPFAKTGDEIPLNVKIIALADRYCARVSARSYRKSLLPNEALSDILLADHRSVDPMLTACFIRVLGTYPTGAIVRLQNGEIGVVVGKGKSGATPLVQVIANPHGIQPPAPGSRDTAIKEYAIREMLSEDQSGLRFSMQQIWGDAALP